MFRAEAPTSNEGAVNVNGFIIKRARRRIPYTRNAKMAVGMETYHPYELKNANGAVSTNTKHITYTLDM